MPWQRRGLAVPLALFACSGCIDVEVDGRPPVAEAGPDQAFPDDGRADITLDGSESRDPDGTIVDYEWRYTGDPRAEGAPAIGDDDAGTADSHPANPTLEMLGLDTLPDFCPVEEPDEAIIAPARWCELEPDGGATITLQAGAGVHRFTLWVTDDDGHVATDSLVVVVGADLEVLETP